MKIGTMKRELGLLGWLAPVAAMAISYPPYDLYPYLADDTDTPPLNYTKVCEPGRPGEANASYVVLGVFFPRTYQAVAADYSGDLVIPAMIDGLPVRKINEGAFILCSKLTSVTVPPTVREIGDRAFCWCTSLTNVVFSEGLTTIGSFAFSNCVNLASVKLPATLAQIGEGCFEKCNALTDICFRGNAPYLPPPNLPGRAYLGEPWYTTASPPRPKIHINRNTWGWIAPYVKGVPEKWPVIYGYLQAYETVGEIDRGTAVEMH